MLEPRLERYLRKHRLEKIIPFLLEKYTFTLSSILHKLNESDYEYLRGLLTPLEVARFDEEFVSKLTKSQSAKKKETIVNDSYDGVKDSKDAEKSKARHMDELLLQISNIQVGAEVSQEQKNEDDVRSKVMPRLQHIDGIDKANSPTSDNGEYTDYDTFLNGVELREEIDRANHCLAIVVNLLARERSKFTSSALDRVVASRLSHLSRISKLKSLLIAVEPSRPRYRAMQSSFPKSSRNCAGDKRSRVEFRFDLPHTNGLATGIPLASVLLLGINTCFMISLL